MSDLALVVDRSPEPEPFASDPNHHLVEVPGRARTRSPAPQLAGEKRAEFEHPAPDRLVGDLEPAFGKQVLDVAEAEREPKVEPDRVLDDIRREAMTMKGRAGHHAIVALGAAVTTPRWQDRLFIWLARSANDASQYFGIPSGRAVEVGTQIAV